MPILQELRRLVYGCVMTGHKSMGSCHPAVRLYVRPPTDGEDADLLHESI